MVEGDQRETELREEPGDFASYPFQQGCLMDSLRWVRCKVLLSRLDMVG